jgi:CO/xanthine dehydrogenase Mo-binding subunit
MTTELDVDVKTTIVGKSIARREDKVLLTGRARFTDDLTLPRMGVAATLPSPYAHARILSIDTSKAKALPGVYCVITGKEAKEYCGPLPTLSSAPIEQYCIAVDKVRHVGEPVAAVLAKDRYIAEDAIALIEVEYEPLPPVSTIQGAIEATGDAIIHEQLKTNIAAKRHYVWGPVEEAFGTAHRIVRRNFKWPRVASQPMETNAAVADYDPVRESMTIFSNLSMGSLVQGMLGNTMKIAPNKMNLHPMYVGGSFGGKCTNLHSTAIAAVLSRIACRPAKYMEDRLEHMTNGNSHGSDREYVAELCCDKDGLFTGLRLRVNDDYGAYFGMNLGSHGNSLAQVTGPYKIGALEYDVTAVFSNKTQQTPYRGFGGEVTNFVLERLVDAMASELGVDGIELRRKNFIPKDEFPYKLPNGNLYDSGDYHSVLDKALKLGELETFERLKEERRAQGKRIGIGIATVNERSVLSSTEIWMLDKDAHFPFSTTPESARVTIDSSGLVTVTLFAAHWGNSPETMAVQLASEKLGVPPDSVHVVYAGTAGGMASLGPAGSRYTVMIAGAIAGACRQLNDKLKKLAAHMLQIPESDVVPGGGIFKSKNDPSIRVTLQEVAISAYMFRLSFPDGEDYRTGLNAEYTYDHPCASLPKADRSDMGIFYPIVGHACHIAVVEVDEGTGRVEFLRYVAVHDAGTIVNPTLVNGQIRGGIAQGIGTALYEQYCYDENGQLLNSSLADYLVPTASEIPNIVIGHVETKSPFTEMGIKGCGEGGRLAAMPAIAAAIDNAFADEKVYVDRLPVTPSVLRDLRNGKTLPEWDFKWK